MPKPDVVITSFEALVSDASALKALSWDVVVVDARTRMASALSRAYQALYGVHCRARAIVAHPSLLKTVSSARPPCVRPTRVVIVRPSASFYGYCLWVPPVAALSDGCKIRVMLL